MALRVCSHQWMAVRTVPCRFRRGCTVGGQNRPTQHTVRTATADGKIKLSYPLLSWRPPPEGNCAANVDDFFPYITCSQPSVGGHRENSISILELDCFNRAYSRCMGNNVKYIYKSHRHSTWALGLHMQVQLPRGKWTQPRTTFVAELEVPCLHSELNVIIERLNRYFT